ncbi:Kelch domain-containing protein 10 [Thelohanellus kitauei]|uniref:Kelch domain-containing protein 10 n=1 Tax=Thelohanellus kitauei TaxID=669202 RepID=A0A0C2I7I3_THEKT|nr:Kelch domain-containing protein 10 [Thelohanellus kitauei]
MNVLSVQAELKNRRGHCMASFNEFLVIYGGRCSSSRTLYNELWTYNTITDTWKQYFAPIEADDTCVSSSICAVENLIYIFGGRGFSLFDRATNLLLSFDVINKTWRTLSPSIDDYDPDLPPPLYGSGLFYHSGSLYVLGGVDNYMVVFKMYRFCLKTLTWSLVGQKEPTPSLDYRIFGTVFRDELYIFGGPAEIETNKFASVNIFKFSSYTWSTRATNVKEKWDPNIRIHDLYTFSSHFGYLSRGKDLTGYNSDIWRIDLETLHWCKLDYTFPSGLILHGMTVVNGCYLYSYGGVDDGVVHSNILRRIILQPPTLYSLCLGSINRLLKSKTCKKLVPPSILDDLNSNVNDQYFDV